MKIKLRFLIILMLPCLASWSQVDSSKQVLKLTDLSLEELMDIRVVTASGYLQKTSEAPSTIQVITAKQIKERGYEQLEDVLKDIAGIDLIHLNGYAPTFFYFRGMYGAENLRSLLMIDGIPENNIIGSNDMAGPAYNLHNAERIEIIWGPASALYGANAFGGVINIITKKGADVEGLTAEKGFGSFNSSLEKFMFGIQKSKFDIAISGSLYSTDGPRFMNRDPNYSASYVDKAYSLTGKISYSTKRSITTLGFRAYETPMGWGTFFNSPTVFLGLPPQGYANKGVIGLIARDVLTEKSGLESPFAQTLYLQNEFKPGTKLNFLSRVVYRQTGIGDDSYAYITIDGKKLIRVITGNNSNRISGEIMANFSPSQNHVFSGGIQFYQDNVESGNRRSTLDTNTIYMIDGKHVVTNLYSTFLPRKYDIRNTFGSYLQYVLNTSLLHKTIFTIGGRFDYNDYFGNSISPRLVIVNQLTDRTTFKLQFGSAFRAPTNTEIYQAPTNFQLKTEKIKTYEANFIYNLSKKFIFHVNGYRNDLRDVIFIGNLSNLQINKNPGKITVKGIETRLDFLSKATSSGFINLTYQDAISKNSITNAQRATSGVAKWKGNVSFSTEIDNLFTFSLTENWIGARNAPSTSPYGEVPGYFLSNAVFTTKPLFHTSMTASITVNNLFDKKWFDPGFRTADGLIYSTVLEQPGRTGMLKIAMTFK